MKRVLLALAFSVLVCGSVQAQHSDVEFGYDDTSNPTALIFEVGEVTSEGLAVFESEFEALDPFNPDDLSSDEPGFTTEPSENLLVNQGDQIWLNAVDASSSSSLASGYLNFYNPLTGMLENTGRVAVQGNSSSVGDLVLNGAGIESGSTRQFIDVGGSDQEAHDHVIIDLLDDSTALVGAYGILFELESDFDGDGTPELVSDRFWIVLNHGLSEEDFETLALPAFGVSAIPEPGSIAFLLLGATALGVRRRRK